ncbi:putative membrane protein [Kutzneria viridogrisea]|uniref:Membrane protein n=1 Tax=Kutzneria viridogrisea TaxID=47990 RepID=A0ABR6BHD4_9PSEU|nr:hypothetical protein [Kutzneria albida]MBA8926294.1 putative membrane protein [Kutzneria viridogrisea]
MTKLFLIVHVLASVVFIGPVTVAASLFPRYARLAAAEPDGGHTAVLRLLHRISRVYAVLGVAVPVFGFATAGAMHVTGDAWVIVSIVLTGAAALLLGLVVIPAQARVLGGEPPVYSRLAMSSGVFALLWAVVVVLMIVRPGSSTGV